MRRYFKPIFLILLCSYATKSISQENLLFNNIVNALDNNSNEKVSEKTYIQTDKDYYITGETIWCKIFLVNATSHFTSEKSKVIYLELLNEAGEVQVQQKLYVLDFGANGAIEIPEEQAQGNYTLRAYTKYMLNEKQLIFHSKKISVSVPKKDIPTKSNKKAQVKSEKTEKKKQEKPLISFYPEGGNLISGIPSFLGVKVTDAKGNGISLQGKIVDDENNVVSIFETYEFGLGRASVNPNINKKHYASILVNGKEEKYPLPNAMQTGYTLGIQNFGNYITLNVASNIKNGLEGIFLIGHIRGRTIFKHIAKTNDSKYSLKLLTSKLEDGVAQFTLFTATGEPVCERLVFIDNPNNDTSLSIKTNSKQYASREKVEVALSLLNKNNDSIKGNFTASVITSANQISNNVTIESWLLLNSDIGANLSNANYFFEEKTDKRKYLLDLLMLTHGWRRFVWKDLLGRNVDEIPSFKPEKGIMVNGTTTSFRNTKKLKPSHVTFSILEKGIYQTEQSTSAIGEFSFGPLLFQDDLAAVIQAKPIKKSKKSRENEFSIHIEDNFPNIIFQEQKKSSDKTIKFDFPEKYLDLAYKKKVADFKSQNPNVIEIEEVVVKAKIKKTRKELVDEAISKITIYGEPDNRVFKDSLGDGGLVSAIDMIRNVAGVRVYGAYPDQEVKIRGLNSIEGTGFPLFLLDGMAIDSLDAQQLTANEIEFVDVLKGPIGAALYGSRGGSGVVAFHSIGAIGIFDDSKAEPSPIFLNLKLKGFSKTREFFSPNYTVSKPRPTRLDYRTTLHWLPDIEVNSIKSSNFSFFTGDVSGNYLIKIEGITEDGQPVNNIKMFTVE